ncbi:hypothetical protein [Chryseolinea sp. H1M3-3]|uniref:hypothetical protein n=1 Tax=Chryseolinea sp. H1M3-3 TaxID=3034144 RepID=UPI0023EA925F|nr:hypothetical protein [Chryseolinea sp. H1M3-3]
MTIKELSEYIVQHKNGRVPYPYGDDFIVSHHTRTVLSEHIHITEAHILESCEKASSYDQYIELCRPLAKTDTEAWLREWNKPPSRGRTRRRFR